MGPREQRESGGLINFAYHMEERAWLKARSHRTHTHAYGQVSEPSASFDPPGPPETVHLYLTRINLKTPLFSLPPSICDSCLLFLLLAREGIITAAAATCEPRVSDGSLAAPVPTPEATSFNSYTLL